MRRLRIAVVSWIGLPLAAQTPPREVQPDPLEQLGVELCAARLDLDELRGVSVPERKLVSGSIGLDFTTEYLFRGIPQENQGLIAQPWVELHFRTFETEVKDHTVDVTLGTWNSLHGGQTKHDGSAWYEDDVYAGLLWTVESRLDISARFTAYDSPNGSFDTVQEVSFGASFDDRGLWWAGGVEPSVTFAFEVAGQADAGRKRGIVAEVGIRPFAPLGSIGLCSFEVALPCKVGIGLHDYYELPGGGGDDGVALGYVDVGMSIATELPLETALHSCRVEAGLHYVRLGDSNERRNGGDADELIGTMGFVTTF